MRKEKQNKGFTLVELIIALAVLAFLMTAVSSFMGSSLLNTRKAKSDLKVSASAQLIYNEISDCIMQATNVVIVGRTLGAAPIDFSEPGKTLTGTVGDRVYFVCDKKAAENILAHYDKYGVGSDINTAPSGNVVYFKDVAPTEKILVEELIIETSVPIDVTHLGLSVSNGDNLTLTNKINGKSVSTYAWETAPDKWLFSTKKVASTGEASGQSVNDTCVHRFVFEGKNLYYGKKYAFVMANDDELRLSGAGENKSTHIYSDEMGYVTYGSGTSAATVSGCIATVNSKRGQMGVDLYFCGQLKNASNFTYDSLGLVNIRNSKVLTEGYTEYKEGTKATLSGGGESEGGESGESTGGEGGESGGTSGEGGSSEGGSGESSGE